MFDENGNPIAQGPQGAAAVAPSPSDAGIPAMGAQPVQETAQVPPGVQRRFDEMTAKNHTLERQVAEMTRQQNEFLLSMQRQQQEQAPPPPDIDPELRRQTEYLMSPAMKQMEEMNRRLMMQNASLELRFTGQGEDPRVLQRAQELLPIVLSKGLPSADALTFARGEIVYQDMRNQQVAQNSRQGFNQAGLGMQFQGQAMPPPSHTSGRSALPPVPADIERRSPAEQAAYWEARVGDEPF